MPDRNPTKSNPQFQRAGQRLPWRAIVTCDNLRPDPTSHRNGCRTWATCGNPWAGCQPAPSNHLQHLAATCPHDRPNPMKATVGLTLAQPK